MAPRSDPPAVGAVRDAARLVVLGRLTGRPSRALQVAATGSDAELSLGAASGKRRQHRASICGIR
jgi:hypothetical protein